MTNIRFSHTNIIAKDWRKLADFYIKVFDCQPTGPQRDLHGAWIDKLTELKGARIRGVHLALPGCENGPTLEIYSYEPENLAESPPQISRQGLAHIAFHVDNVEETLAKFIENGGQKFGEIVKKEYAELGLLTVIYARDPEGNFVEIQNWK